VFATRSPHRPNPLGMTPVRLLGIEGRKLILGPCDLIDGTPVFDIKPYVPAFDSFPGEKAGWIDEVDAELNEPPRFKIEFATLAQEQAAWLRENWQIDFMPRMTELLSRDPTPHRTRRIKRRGADAFEIGCGAWRAFFSLAGEKIQVTALAPAYPLRFLHREGYDQVPDRDAQVAYLDRWPSDNSAGP
jgi:tRNA (adenine37-N6)-methyltransferase